MDQKYVEQVDEVAPDGESKPQLTKSASAVAREDEKQVDQ